MGMGLYVNLAKITPIPMGPRPQSYRINATHKIL